MTVVKFPDIKPRLKLRYYFHLSHGLFRLPLVTYQALLSGENTLPELSGTKQHLVEVMIWSARDLAPRIIVRGSICRFNPRGAVDMSDAADGLMVALQGTDVRKSGENVLDVSDVIAGRRWERENKWRPPHKVLSLIAADLRGELKIPRVQGVKH